MEIIDSLKQLHGSEAAEREGIHRGTAERAAGVKAKALIHLSTTVLKEGRLLADQLTSTVTFLCKRRTEISVEVMGRQICNSSFSKWLK